MAIFSESNHHHNASDGVSQRVNSPRFSGPMTRRAHSFKRNTDSANSNGGSGEVELQINSPRSEEGSEGVPVGRHSHNHVTQRVHVRGLLKKPLASIVEDLGFREKKKIGHLMFLVFCGVCIFIGVLKICATGWLGSAIERAQSDKVVLVGIIFCSATASRQLTFFDHVILNFLL